LLRYAHETGTFVKGFDMPERGRFFPKPYRDQEIVSALQHFAA
jgi:hypothetical protein